MMERLVGGVSGALEVVAAEPLRLLLRVAIATPDKEEPLPGLLKAEEEIAE